MIKNIVIESSNDLIGIIKQSLKSMKNDLLTYSHDDINRFTLIKNIQLQELTLEFIENIKK